MIWSFYERNRSFSQTHRFGAFVRHAQRSKKVLFFIREDGFDTLRLIEPFSVVLQISWPAPFFAALRPLARLSSPAVPSRRSFPRSSLCDHSRHWPSREHTIFDSQWFDPTAFGPARLPAPRYLEKLFMALQFQASQLSESKHLSYLKTAHDRLRYELFQRLGLLYSAIVDADTTANQQRTAGDEVSLVWLHHCNLFLPASIRMWVRSSTTGIRRDEVYMSRFSFSHFSQFIVISHTACTVRMVIEESSPVRSGHSAPHDSFEY